MRRSAARIGFSVSLGLVLSLQIASAASPKASFHDAQNRYSVSLPAGWVGPHEDDLQEGNVVFSRTDPAYPQALSIRVLPTDQKLISTYLKIVDAQNAHAWEGDASVTVLSTKYTKIAGLNAILREEMWNAAGFSTVNLYTLKNKHIYQFILAPTAGMTSPKSRDLLKAIAALKIW